MGRIESPARPRREPALVGELLRYAATPSKSLDNRALDLQWDKIDDQQIEHVVAAGLAPLLYRAAGRTLEQAPPAWRDALQAADLTALVTYGNLCDTAGEVIDACRERGIRVTLLKGISIGDQYYPSAHLRLMGDIDLLVANGDRQWVESMMRGRGYIPMPDFPEETTHHGVPLLHPERRVWVEIHTSLFPTGDRLLRKGLFSPSQIAAQTVASTFQGRPVGRLSSEMQLLYMASYWIRDISRVAFHSSYAAPLFDAVYLLKASGQSLAWDALLEWLDDDIGAASLYIMLAYLSGRDLDRSSIRILSHLAARQKILGASELRIICAMIDSQLVGGQPFMGRFGERYPGIACTVLNGMLVPGSHVGKMLSLPWYFLFPPGTVERYTIGYQLRRITRLLRGEGGGRPAVD